MYHVYLKIFKDFGEIELCSLYLGVFNRVSTAEKRRREFQECNPMFKFLLYYEPI